MIIMIFWSMEWWKTCRTNKSYLWMIFQNMFYQYSRFEKCIRKFKITVFTFIWSIRNLIFLNVITKIMDRNKKETNEQFKTITFIINWTLVKIISMIHPISTLKSSTLKSSIKFIYTRTFNFTSTNYTFVVFHPFGFCSIL